MKKYWLVLFPDTFLWLKNIKGIIYNSINFKYFTFSCSEEIIKLCDTLEELDSLYSVELTEIILGDKHVKQWVADIVDIESGKLIEQNGINKKLVSYYPSLMIQDNTDHLRWEHKLNIGGKIIQNLDELIFYINSSPFGSVQLFKQAYYPLIFTKSLDFDLIESFVWKCRNRSLSKLTFIGDFINYRDFNKLQDWVTTSEYHIEMVFLLDDVKSDIAKFKDFLRERVTISVVVNDYATFPKQFKLLNDMSNKVNWKFPVSSINQFELANTIIQKKDLQDCEIIPLYDGKNKSFFKENIYMTKEEFEDINLSRRQVFINMALNIHYFGKLTIMPDGQVYANVNQEPLGTIDTPIYDMIFKEMTDGYSWLHVRNAEPCSHCVYQWLCPAPGNYEQVIGKLNLCHVFDEVNNKDKALNSETHD